MKIHFFFISSFYLLFSLRAFIHHNDGQKPFRIKLNIKPVHRVMMKNSWFVEFQLCPTKTVPKINCFFFFFAIFTNFYSETNDLLFESSHIEVCIRTLQ